jgi:hypothetical protein
MCLNETSSKFRIDKNISDAFPTQNDLKQGNDLSSLRLKFTICYAIRNIQGNPGGGGSVGIEWDNELYQFLVSRGKR